MNNGLPPQFEQLIAQAMTNPNFIEQCRQSNPQLYQQAMQLRNSMDPRTAIMQVAQSKGINPNILFQRLGIK